MPKFHDLIQRADFKVFYFNLDKNLLLKNIIKNSIAWYRKISIHDRLSLISWQKNGYNLKHDETKTIAYISQSTSSEENWGS